MNDFFKFFVSLFVCGLMMLAGCGNPNDQYQPKPEDIPAPAPANRTGDSGSFLPPGNE